MASEKFQKILDKCAEIEKLLRDNRVYADCYPYMDLPVAVVDIHWGDWKHDHLRAKWLIKENMKDMLFLNEVVTEEDGSDCYSAEHRYILQNL